MARGTNDPAHERFRQIETHTLALSTSYIPSILTGELRSWNRATIVLFWWWIKAHSRRDCVSLTSTTPHHVQRLDSKLCIRADECDSWKYCHAHVTGKSDILPHESILFGRVGDLTLWPTHCDIAGLRLGYMDLGQNNLGELNEHLRWQHQIDNRYWDALLQRPIPGRASTSSQNIWLTELRVRYYNSNYSRRLSIGGHIWSRQDSPNPERHTHRESLFPTNVDV